MNHIKKIKSYLFALILSIFFLVGCSTPLDQNQNQNQTQILMEYALYDFALPPDAEIQMDNTIILGSGDMWAGQILMYSPSSPVELIRYFTENAKSSDWDLASSTISSKVLLVFNKENRIATIEISKERQNLLSSLKTKVKVAINHPNSIKETQIVDDEFPSVEYQLN